MDKWYLCLHKDKAAHARPQSKIVSLDSPFDASAHDLGIPESSDVVALVELTEFDPGDADTLPTVIIDNKEVTAKQFEEAGLSASSSRRKQQ